MVEKIITILIIFLLTMFAFGKLSGKYIEIKKQIKDIEIQLQDYEDIINKELKMEDLENEIEKYYEMIGDGLYE